MIGVTLTLALLVAIATAQTTPNPSMEDWMPFMNPGEILPEGALTVPYILDIVGGLWKQYRLIDSYAYICTDVLPELSQKIPEIGNFSDVWEPVCEEIISARNNEDGLNATALCETLVLLASEMVTVQPNMTSPIPAGIPPLTGTDIPPGNNMTMPGPAGLPIDLSVYMSLLDIVGNVTMNLYQIDINDPLTICPQAHHFLEPSLPKLIYNFGTELLSSLMTKATPNCEAWDGFLQSLGINSTSPLYPFVQDVEGLLSQVMGFDNKESLCANITDALTHQTTSDLVMKVMNHLFHVLTDEDACGTVAHDAINIINDVIILMTSVDNSTNSSFTITNDVIYQYTGLMNVEDACEAIDRAFSGCHSKGFDRDECSICVLSPGDGVPSFLTSNHRDCDMKCPLDMEYGAVMNECDYCVLGGTGLPMDEGLNACKDCGEDTSCIGCDGEPNSGKVEDNCDICDGNHTDCMKIVTIEPSSIPENTDYNITIHGAGFHIDPTPVCIFMRSPDMMEFNVTMDVVSPSMGYCPVNFMQASYVVSVIINTSQFAHTDSLEVYTPITIDGVSEDVFTLDTTIQYILRFTAADDADFTQADALGLQPYLIFLDDDNELPPLMGYIEGDTTLVFTLQAPPESTQVIVSPSFNQVDLLPTSNGEPFTVTFYDPAPQLDMATLSFKPTGNVLILKFSEKVEILSDVISNCNAIFVAMVEDGEAERNLLGVGSRCSLSRNHEVLEIMLGQGDNLIEPGESITIREGVIYGDGKYPSAAKETNITASAENFPTVEVLLRGATSVSSCGNVSISSRGSTGSASRSFTYMWMVSTSDGQPLSTNLTDAVQETNTSHLNINGNLLVEDVVYRFDAFATNFLGGTGAGFIEIVRTQDMVPDLTVTPSPVNPRRVMLSESFYLNAQVTFYSDCEGAEPKEIEYTWSVNNDDVILDETTKNSKSLYVPAFSLPGDTPIIFTVEIKGVNGSSGSSSDVTINTFSSVPRAVIVGGLERDIGIGSGMVELDGSRSHDPDQSGTGDLEFTWRCVQVSENILCTSAEDGSFFPSPEQLESTSVSFNASHMTAGKMYKLTLMVSSKYKESTETSVFISAMAGNAPQVIVSNPAPGPVLSTKPLALTAHIKHSSPVDITWSIIGGNVAVDDIDFTGSATNTALDGSTWSVVHIQPGILRPGETYTVLVMATNEMDQSGSSQMGLVVASGVSSCQMTLANGNTYMELEEITLTIDNCVTEEGAYPLTYQLLMGNGRSLTPAGVESQIYIVGPPAREDIDNTTFVAHVCNAHDSCSSFSIVASVEMRTDIDSEAFKNAIVSQETLKGDYLKALTNLNALYYVEDRLGPDVRRRRRSTETRDRTADQLTLLHNATTTAVLDISTASTLIDACESIVIDNLSPTDIDLFLDMLHALVMVFRCEEAIPSYSASVVLEIVKHIKAMNNDQDTIDTCRELTMTLSKANIAGLILGDSPAETSSNDMTSSVFYAIPQGTFMSKSGEGAFYVDLGSDVADMYGGFWHCATSGGGTGLCTGINIQFDHYSDDIDPYSTDDDMDEDRDNRASAILDITLYDPSSCDELMVDSLSDQIRINMTVSGKKRNHDFKCHIWMEDDKEWSSDGVGTMKIGDNMVECTIPRTGACVILAEGRRGSANTVIIIVSIIGALLVLALIIAIVIVIKKKTQKDKGDGNVATNDRSSAVATSMTDAKQVDGSQEASTEYAYDFNMQNMASKVNC